MAGSGIQARAATLRHRIEAVDRREGRRSLAVVLGINEAAGLLQAPR